MQIIHGYGRVDEQLNSLLIQAAFPPLPRERALVSTEWGAETRYGHLGQVKDFSPMPRNETRIIGGPGRNQKLHGTVCFSSL